MADAGFGALWWCVASIGSLAVALGHHAGGAFTVSPMLGGCLVGRGAYSCVEPVAEQLSKQRFFSVVVLVCL